MNGFIVNDTVTMVNPPRNATASDQKILVNGKNYSTYFYNLQKGVNRDILVKFKACITATLFFYIPCVKQSQDPQTCHHSNSYKPATTSLMGPFSKDYRASPSAVRSFCSSYTTRCISSKDVSCGGCPVDHTRSDLLLSVLLPLHKHHIYT